MDPQRRPAWSPFFSPECAVAAHSRLTLACEKSALFSPMFYLPAFIFSSGYSLGLGFLAELRLLVLRQFQAFLAASPCAACASSYHFSSSALPRWHNVFSQFAPVVNSEVSVFASVANRAVKPTCLRQAAYFRSLACLNSQLGNL